jgi:hypothetical protein
MEEKGRLPEPNQEELEACSIEELFERLNQVIGGLEDGSSSLIRFGTMKRECGW